MTFPRQRLEIIGRAQVGRGLLESGKPSTHPLLQVRADRLRGGGESAAGHGLTDCLVSRFRQRSRKPSTNDSRMLELRAIIMVGFSPSQLCRIEVHVNCLMSP